LALAAKDRKIALYTPSLGLKVTARTYRDARLEEMSPGELGGARLKGAQIRNVYFDLIPPKLGESHSNGGG